jgi:dihydroorotate dehydrogenase (NAD+) catalytic subunit
VGGLRQSLAVELGRLRLPTPVVVASGCLGAPREVAGLVDVRKLGGIVARSVTYAPNKGAPSPRMAETPSGLISATGFQNPGAVEFTRELADLVRIGVPVLASVAGETVEEYHKVAAILAGVPGIAGLEANLSFPDAERRGRAFDSAPDQAAEAVAAVSRATRLPLFAKLSADGADVVRIAHACLEAGAEGVTLINSIPAMAVPSVRGNGPSTAVTGRLSGPAIRPVAVRTIFEVARALPAAPIFGVGGVGTTGDALELLAAGAWAVQVGTAMMVNPAVLAEIAAGIQNHLEKKGLLSPAELRGRAFARTGTDPGARTLF